MLSAPKRGPARSGPETNQKVRTYNYPKTA